LIDVFNAFDNKGTGLIDYKEFAALLCRSAEFSDAGSSFLESHLSAS